MNFPSKSHAAPRFVTGIGGLDTVLHGGLMRGGIYIVQGSPGAGKTILTNQICFNHAARGGIAIYFTLLSENHARMMDNMRALAFFDETQIPDRLVYQSAFSELRDEGLEGLARLLRREIQRRKTSLLVVDGLVSTRAFSDGDQAFKAFLHSVQEVALLTDCTMLLTTSGSREPSVEQTMVDGLIALRPGECGWEATSDLHVTKFRGSAYVRGRHAYKITDRGISVHPRIEAIYAVPSAADGVQRARVGSGVDNLDAALNGGLPECSTTLLTGPSGIGKTTLGLHFLARSSSAEPGLMFGFHETPARIKLKGAKLGLPLESLEGEGSLEFLWQTPQSDLVDVHAERLLNAVEARSVRRLFIDGLTSFRRAFTDPGRAERFFAALLSELRVRGVTTFFTLELPDILSTKAHVPIDDLSSLAENIVLMRFLESRTKLHRVCSVMKVRDSGFDPSSHEFFISDVGWVLNRETFTFDAPQIDGAGVLQGHLD